jgi:5-formyltetrahydrofolate cyclo-ligase
MNVQIARAQIRKYIKSQCLQLDSTFKKQADLKIVNQLLDHPLLSNKSHIGAYWPSGHEVNIAPWFKRAWAKNICCYLPITLDKQLIFGRYYPDTILHPNQWGILEPSNDKPLTELNTLEVVLMPLVAFDSKGHRLGRGKGYYDRSFSFLLPQSPIKQPYLIGIAYALQKVDTLIPATWDVPLNEVITETHHYRFNA